MRQAEHIIRSRGGVPVQGRSDGGNDDERYEAFISTQGFPQMGFSLFCRGGARHGIFYHNLDNLDLIDGEHGEYLRFTHRGKAVTIRGYGLHEAFQAMMEHTLQALYELDEEVWPMPPADTPRIERVEVTNLLDKHRAAD